MDLETTFPNAVIDDGNVVVPPGETTEIQVEVGNHTGQTEVTIIAVDKSILELLPYPLQAPSIEFILDLAESYTFEYSSQYLVAPNAIKILISHFLARKALNPWFDPETDVSMTG